MLARIYFFSLIHGHSVPVFTTGLSSNATFYSRSKVRDFKAVKNRQSDNDQSPFIFPIFVLGKTVQSLITCHEL